MTAEPLVLLVEDEAPMRRFLRASLTSHGYGLVEAATAAEAMALAPRHQPDVVLLDLGLPDGDGIELCARLREWMSAPIIVLSARRRENDKVQALDAGADDYLTKPFGVNELLARLRAALRRAHNAVKPDDAVIAVGGLNIDLARHQVRLADRDVHLTPIEYKLLVFLATHAGKVCTHRQILSEVWGDTPAAPPHYVRVYMQALRKKLEADPARPVLLLNEAGVGYRLSDRT